MDQLKYFFATDDTILKEISFKQVFKVWFRLFFSYQLINNRIKDKFHSIQKQEFLFFLSNNNTSFFLQIKTIEINSPNVSLIISKKKRKKKILDDWTIFPIFSFSILLSRKTINKIQKLGAIDSTSWHKSSILPFKRSLINPQQRLIDLPFYFLRRSTIPDPSKPRFSLMSLANTRVCLIYPRQCPPTGEKKRFIQGQRGSCEEHSIIELENDTSVRFISMYGLGNPAAAILISFLLPLVNRSREKYACYSRLIRARIQKEVGDSKKKGGGEEKKKERFNLWVRPCGSKTAVFGDHVQRSSGLVFFGSSWMIVPLVDGAY